MLISGSIAAVCQYKMNPDVELERETRNRGVRTLTFGRLRITATNQSIVVT